MKKRSLALCATTLSAALLITAVFASRGIENADIEKEISETTQLQAAINSSDVLKSRYEIDDGLEIVNNADTLANMANMAETEYMASADNAIQLYRVELAENTTSLASQLEKDNEYWFVPKEIDGKISFIFMKKGEALESVTEKIEALNVSDERKEKMLERAIKREGKWFVNRIDKQNDNEKANTFVNSAAIENNLEKNDVTNIRKMKYIVIDNNGSLGIWVQTLEGAEYIIPYMTGTEELVSNNPYALNEVVYFIAK